MIMFKSFFHSQIPEFQSAAQLIPDMDHIPVMTLQPLHTIPTINEPSDEDAASGSEFPFPQHTGQGLELHSVGFAGQIPIVRSSTTNEGISNANDTPATSRAADTQLTHPIPEPSIEIPSALEVMEIPDMSDGESEDSEDSESLDSDTEILMPAEDFPQFLEGLLSPFRPDVVNEDYNNRMGRSINAAIQRIVERLPIDNINIDNGNNDDDDENDDNDDEDDDDDDNAADDEIATDEEGVSTVNDGPSSAKKRREQSSEDGGKDNDKGSIEADGDTSCAEDNKDDDQSDVLPDLPQPKPDVKREPLDFSAEEHIFLAWAKTMSTFTAKRQATIKMQINKIMSEAEFEDLDDEFFAGYLINVNLCVYKLIITYLVGTYLDTYFLTLIYSFNFLVSCV